MRAEPAHHLHRAVPRPARRHPDRRHRQGLRRHAACAGCAEGEVPTLGNWFRAAGYDTHYDGKWHISHADLHDDNGGPLATNDDDGVVDPGAVRATSTPTRLRRMAFRVGSGPEPHGAGLANSGTRRDPLIADRVVAWLNDRYARRRAGDPAALRPFLLVASFVNPHDIVLFPTWVRRTPLQEPSPLDPPPVPAAPTADEDLRTKPAAQIAFREAYYSGYGPAAAIQRIYNGNAQRYRDLYYRLHAEVDAPDRPGAPRGHRGRLGQRRAGAHLRSR